MIRTLVASLIACLAVGAPAAAVEAAPAPAPLPTPAVAGQADLAALAALAVEHGFPDAAGARILRGPVKLVRRLPGGSTHREDREGLHLELRDGRWLVGLATLAAKDEVGVDRAALSEVAPAALPEAAAALAQNTGWQPGMMDGFLEQVAVADRDRVRGALGAMPLLFLGLSQGGMQGSLAVHLVRLGAPCAADVAVLTGLAQAWNPLSVDPSTPGPLRLAAIDWETLAGTERRDVTAPAAEVALRAVLVRHFRTLALGGSDGQDPMARMVAMAGGGATASPPDPAAQAAALAAAESLVPADAAGARADLARVRARLAVPVTVPVDAPLDARLAVWDGGLARPDGGEDEDRMEFDQTAQALAMLGLPANGTTALVAGENDIDALLALLEDPRPCRWLDLGRPRTLGDNALRAIGAILGCDPRALIGRDPGAAWTDAERAATAAALRAWWAEGRPRPLAERLVAHLPALAPRELGGLLERTPADARGALLDALAAHWAGGAPAGLDEDALARVLDASDGHPGLATAVAAWPATGDLALFLAAFHLTRGDRAPLTAQLDAALAVTGEHDYRLHQVLALLRFAPAAADLQRLVALLRGPLDAPATATLIGIAAQGSNWGGRAMNLLETWQRAQTKADPEAAQRRGQLLPLALYAVVLGDDRPAGEALRGLLGSRHTMVITDGDDGAPAAVAPAPPAANLRVCDVAGAGFASFQWQARQLLGDDLSERAAQLAVDPAKPIAERDRALVELRRLIADQLAPALTEAGLPDLAPAGGPPAGDEKSLF